MKFLKVGLIGCGRIGSLLEQDTLRGKPCTHAGGFQSTSGVRIVAGCDINRSRMKSFGTQWGVKHLYEDYREMLLNENLDIVSIATWTHLHAEMVLASVRAGIRGVFCEKPIALNLTQARSMVQACQKKNIPLVINHERRWDARYQKVLKLIQSGKIGEPRTIVGNALSSKPIKLPVRNYGGGAMFHDGTHLTDLFLYFFGPVDWVIGSDKRPFGRKHIEESVHAMIKFKNGVMGFIEGGGARKYFNFELDIQGSEGRILIGNGGQELYVTRKSSRFSNFHELEKVNFPLPKNPKSPFSRGARDLVNCIRNGTKTISSGEDGLKALEVISAIYRSAQYGGKKVFITKHR